MDYIFLIVIIVVMFGMMFWQSKKAKQQQAERQDFRANLQPGTEVITIGGVIGKVVSVDTEYEEIVIDSEGSQIRFGFNAISREYVRPAYVHDDEVDENGNPLSTDSTDEDQAAQEPIEGEIEAVVLIYLPLYEHFGRPRITVAVCHGVQPPTLVVQFFTV